ncbi:FG-GAP-like repeat-containing protein, partial [Bacteroidota bacterium]
MKITRGLLLVGIIVYSFYPKALSQEKVYWDIVSKIRNEGFNNSKVMDYAWYLTDVIGPRLTGSKNMKNAQHWTKGKMEEMGLENAALEKWGDNCVEWNLKHVSIHMIEPNYQMIIGYPLGYTPGTNGKIVENAIIVDIQTREDLNKYKGKLRNSIVLYTPKMKVNPRFIQDAFRHTDESLDIYRREGTDFYYKKYGSGQFEQVRYRPQGIGMDEINEFFKSEGVLATIKAGDGSDGTVRVGNGPLSSDKRTIKNINKQIPMLVVAAEHYNRLYRLLENNIKVKMEIDVRVEMDDSNNAGYNVIGEIPGTDLADEIVMIGGHMDAFHVSTGATDNASGVAVTMEAMRILKAIGAKPRRTIRIALWDSEENGKLGSQSYENKHFGNPRDGKTLDYDKFSVYFNMDNGTGQFRGVHQQDNPYVAPIFEAWMKPFADLKVNTLSKFSNRGTDHLSFDRAGLPGFQFLQDRIAYRSRTWHYNMDVYDQLLPHDLMINSVVMASFAYHAAMRDEKMPRKTFTEWNPDFKLTQEDLFKDPGALTNSIADYDNDGDLDIFVGFSKTPNRLYRNDNGVYTDVAKKLGVADADATLSSAWCDYNNDGKLDLFLCFVPRGKTSYVRLYENTGKKFKDVTHTTGLQTSGSFRQVSWIDYDNDGDVDLYIGLRNLPNVLYRNDKGKFTNVAKQLGVDDARKTVGAVWFDYDKDGDLDLYVANMDGDKNGLYRNDGNNFTDVAPQMGVETGGRPVGNKLFGTVRPSLVDYDNDGNMDIFLANYGPNGLYSIDKNNKYVNVAPGLGLAIDNCYDTGSWGDYNNDGYPDLYVNGTVTRGKSFRDYLFQNDGKNFIDVTPSLLLKQNADHGAQWVDYNNDGSLDLALAGAAGNGMHYLFNNNLSDKQNKQSLKVLVLDENGHYTMAGAEVRVYRAGTNNLLGTNILDTGSGYNSQNAMPVHFGLGDQKNVDVKITRLTKNGRKTATLSN